MQRYYKELEAVKLQMVYNKEDLIISFTNIYYKLQHNIRQSLKSNNIVMAATEYCTDNKTTAKEIVELEDRTNNMENIEEEPIP